MGAHKLVVYLQGHVTGVLADVLALQVPRVPSAILHQSNGFVLCSKLGFVSFFLFHIFKYSLYI